MNVEQDVVRLALEGHPPREIAPLVGRAVCTVQHYIWLARRRGVAIPRFKTGGARPSALGYVAVRKSVLAQLTGPAAARGLTERELGARLIEACLEAGLIDAVLDDAEELE